MGNFINSTTLIPLIPLITSLIIFILLVSFNRTINRLTKPVTALVSLSLLSSAFISAFDYFNKIEEELDLSKYIKYLKYLKETNLIVHLNLVNEKIIIIFSFIMSLVIGLSFYKMPRKKGYVLLMISLGLVSSSVIFTILLIDFSALI